MKKIAWILAIVVLLAFVVSGPCLAASHKHHAFFENGTVRFIADGNFWGIVGDSGRHYKPIYLAEELKEEGLRLWFKFKKIPNTSDTHAWGIPIQILRYRIIDEAESY